MKKEREFRNCWQKEKELRNCREAREFNRTTVRLTITKAIGVIVGDKHGTTIM